MSSVKNIKKQFAQYLLDEDRMIVEPTSDIIRSIPLDISVGDTAAWLKAVKNLLGDAVELRKPFTPMGEWKLVVKDRGVLFTIAEAETMEEMANRRKNNQDA